MSKPAEDVLRLAEVEVDAVRGLFEPHGLSISLVPCDSDIPGSHWGAPEAGLIADVLYARPDTPVHSVLHEAGHWLMMDAARRSSLHTDAKGSALEENGVCYLQVLLADRVEGMGRERMFRDMDAWGYSFRLGSAAAWFEQDADEARQWVEQQRSRWPGLITGSI